MSASESDFEELREAYIKELSAAVLEVSHWWENLELRERRGRDPPLLKRWPTGPAGHPRIISVFRKYFLMIEDLNDRNIHEWDVRPRDFDEEDQWQGNIDDPPPLAYRPRDVLIFDLADTHPDLFEIMEGMVFIPIGLNANRDLV